MSACTMRAQLVPEKQTTKLLGAAWTKGSTGASRSWLCCAAAGAAALVALPRSWRSSRSCRCRTGRAATLVAQPREASEDCERFKVGMRPARHALTQRKHYVCVHAMHEHFAWPGEQSKQHAFAESKTSRILRFLHWTPTASSGACECTTTARASVQTHP